MHHQICISQTPQSAKPHIHTEYIEIMKSTFKTSMDAWLQGYDVKAVFDSLKYKLGSIRLCLIYNSSTRTMIPVLYWCPASRLGWIWWRLRTNVCEISNRETRICTIKSESAKPQTATQQINTKHTEIMKCTFKTSTDGWWQGHDEVNFFWLFEIEKRDQSNVPLIKINNNIWIPILRKYCTG